MLKKGKLIKPEVGEIPLRLKRRLRKKGDTKKNLKNGIKSKGRKGKVKKAVCITKHELTINSAKKRKIDQTRGRRDSIKIKKKIKKKRRHKKKFKKRNKVKGKKR